MDKNNKRAKTLMERAYKLDRKNYYLIKDYMCLLKDINEFEKAIEIYNELLKDFQENGRLKLYYAWCHMAIGNTDTWD